MSDSNLYPITVPKWGIEMQEGTITGWQVEEGALVTKGDDLIDIETDKIVNTLEAPIDGVVCKQLVAEGDTLKVGELLGVMAAEPAAANIVEQFIAEFVPADASFGIDEDESATATVTTQASEATQGIKADAPRVSPVARRVAEQLGVDLSQVKGTGRNGRISKADVEAAAQGASAAGTADPEAAVEPLSSRRQTIARRLVEAKQAIPHYYLNRDLAMDQAMAFKTSSGASLNAIIVKAVAQALAEHPNINIHVSEDGIARQSSVSVNLAIDTPHGLVAPLLADIGDQSVNDIQQATQALVERARANTLTSADLALGGFTVSNLGTLGIESFTAIINPPQAAILAVGGVRDTPLIQGNKVRRSKQMKATLSCDHRVIDGADGARFLQTLSDRLQNFED